MNRTQMIILLVCVIILIGLIIGISSQDIRIFGISVILGIQTLTIDIIINGKSNG